MNEYIYALVLNIGRSTRGYIIESLYRQHIFMKYLSETAKTLQAAM